MQKAEFLQLTHHGAILGVVFWVLEEDTGKVCVLLVEIAVEPGDLSCLPCALLFGRSRV